MPRCSRYRIAKRRTYCPVCAGKDGDIYMRLIIMADDEIPVPYACRKHRRKRKGPPRE